MKTKPSAILEVYENLYQLPPKEIWGDLTKLKLEVLQLAEKYCPNVEVVHIYDRVNEGRKKFENSIK